MFLTDLPAQASLNAPTKAILRFLHDNRGLRDRIRAAPGRTVAYCGDFRDGAAWVRLHQKQLMLPQTHDYQTLEDVLQSIPCPPGLSAVVGLDKPPAVRTLADYMQFLTREVPPPQIIPWNNGGFTLWRALSGIYVSNAVGRVRLLIGNVPDPQAKVFYRTEMFVLQRNPAIDLFSRAAITNLRARLRSGQVPGTIELL